MTDIRVQALKHSGST